MASDDSKEVVIYIKQLNTKLSQVMEELEGVKQRLLALEKRTSQSLSPKRQVPVFMDRDDRLGEYQYDTLTPALQETYEVIRRLTEHPGQWVTLEEIMSRSSRSQPTESAYVKTLYRAGYLERKPKIAATPKGRKVRKLLYRTRK